jgi:cell division protein FtsB
MLSQRLKIFFTLFAVIFGFALIYLPGFSKYQELRRKESDITYEIERLQNISAKLAEEERLLQSDSEYLEKVARENLGRVRPGEVVYKILPAQPGAAQQTVIQTKD